MAATIGSAPKTSIMMTISMSVPISSGVRKWEQERQRTRQQQAKYGEGKHQQHVRIRQTFGNQTP
jgi:hypothetical protein